jgi:hypothetical protein
MAETSTALRFIFSRGMGTLTVSPQDPIAEPFRAAMEDNQLTGAWCYLVVGVEGIALVVLAVGVPADLRPCEAVGIDPGWYQIAATG